MRASSEAPADFGVACRRGLKRQCSLPNQDSWCARLAPAKLGAVAVFDGHGQSGHMASHFVKEALTKGVASAAMSRADPSADVENWYRQVHRELCESRELGARLSGTTATVVVHDVARQRLVVSHVGDSGVVLLRRSGAGGLVARRLTRDHKPELEEERARIEAAGGSVLFDGCCQRVTRTGVGAALNMSRSLGDAAVHEGCGVSAMPEVQVTSLGPEDVAVLVASDGIWEVISPQDAAKIVGAFPPHRAMEAAGALADEAVHRWFSLSQGQAIDDITAVIAHFARPGGPASDEASTESPPPSSLCSVAPVLCEHTESTMLVPPV